MKLSTLALIAASLFSTVKSQDDGWVTYTKVLSTATIAVTKYTGTSELTGSGYTTATIPVTNGDAVYTEIVVQRVSAAAEAETTEEAETTSTTEEAEATTAEAETSATTTGDGWVTYTKDLGTATIVVTRYTGDEELTGSEYVTNYITATRNGNTYTETIIGRATATAAASSEDAESSSADAEATSSADAEATSSADVESSSADAEASSADVETSSAVETSAAETTSATETTNTVETYTGGAGAVGVSFGAVALGVALLI
jgi:uncharacterized membrane protein